MQPPHPVVARVAHATSSTVWAPPRQADAISPRVTWLQLQMMSVSSSDTDSVPARADEERRRVRRHGGAALERDGQLGRNFPGAHQDRPDDPIGFDGNPQAATPVSGRQG